MVYTIFILSFLASVGVAVPFNDNSLPNSALVKRGQNSTSITTTLTEGIEWLVPIQVAGKTFNVQLDTGSADL
jgi:aspergillopepsin I